MKSCCDLWLLPLLLSFLVVYVMNFSVFTTSIIKMIFFCVFLYFTTCIEDILYVSKRINFESVEITNKMQLCNRIYYSKVYWRLKLFRASHRLSSGALNRICQPLVYIYMWWPAIVKAESDLENGRSPHAYVNQRLQIQFRAPDDERCDARNKLSLQ